MLNKVELKYGRSEVFFIGTFNRRRGLYIRNNHIHLVKAALARTGVNDFVSQHMPEDSLIANQKAHIVFMEAYHKEFDSEDRFFVSCKKFNASDIEHALFLFDIFSCVGFNREKPEYYVRRFVPSFVRSQVRSDVSNLYSIIGLTIERTTLESMGNLLSGKKEDFFDLIFLEKVKDFVGCRVALLIRLEGGKCLRYGDDTCLAHIDNNYDRLLIECDLDRFRYIRK